MRPVTSRNIVFGWRLDGRRRTAEGLTITAEERARGVVPVTLYSPDGARMQTRKGRVTPDGARCFVPWLGERVQCTIEGGAWVYRVPALEPT